MAFSAPTITHTFQNADGTVSSGAVQFTLQDMMTNGVLSVTPMEVTANLNGSGAISQALCSNVDLASWSTAWSGTPTGGSVILGWNGQLTASLPYNATAAQVQAALFIIQDLQQIVCSGGPWGTAPIVIAGIPGQQPITVNNANILGSGTVAPTQTVNGTVPAPPNNTNWRVDIRIAGAPVKTYYIVVPAVSGSVDLFTLIGTQQQV